MLKKSFAKIMLTVLLTGCVSAEQASSNKPHIITYGNGSGGEIVVLPGQSLDLEHIVKFAKDDNGVFLVQSDTLKNGTYVIDASEVDDTTPGEYELIVTAQSDTGETSQRIIKVTVRGYGSD